jgi:hypothetical protein
VSWFSVSCDGEAEKIGTDQMRRQAGRVRFVRLIQEEAVFIASKRAEASGDGSAAS